MKEKDVLIILLLLSFVILLIAKIGWTTEHNIINLLNETITLNGMKFGNGSIHITVYIDFECPFSQKFIEQIYPKLSKLNVSFIFRCLPSTRNSKEICKFVYCSYKQGKFNESVKLVMNNEPDWSYLSYTELKLKLKKYAKKLNEDNALFTSCLEDTELDEMINSFYTESSSLNIEGTPSFIVITSSRKNNVIEGAKIIGPKSIFYYNNKYIIIIEGNRPFIYFKSFLKKLI